MISMSHLDKQEHPKVVARELHSTPHQIVLSLGTGQHGKDGYPEWKFVMNTMFGTYPDALKVEMELWKYNDPYVFLLQIHWVARLCMQDALYMV